MEFLCQRSIQLWKATSVLFCISFCFTKTCRAALWWIWPQHWLQSQRSLPRRPSHKYPRTLIFFAPSSERLLASIRWTKLNKYKKQKTSQRKAPKKPKQRNPNVFLQRVAHLLWRHLNLHLHTCSRPSHHCLDPEIWRRSLRLCQIAVTRRRIYARKK